jgi:hypothetical protein
MEKELSPLQKKFREFFDKLLDKFGVKSPSELTDDQKKEFFNAIAIWWKKGEGPKKDPEDLKFNTTNENLNESPVGKPGRTTRQEALEYIQENPEKIKELKKIIKQVGGKTVFLTLIDIILDPNFDEDKFKIKQEELEELRKRKIEKVLKGKFL